MMRQMTLRFIPILAAALGAPAAAAQTTSDICSGDFTMPDTPHDGSTTIVRTGSGHTADVTRDGDGTVRVEQHGRDHATLAVQSGDGSRLAISQSGEAAEADVSQNGGCNDASLTQSGNCLLYTSPSPRDRG